MPDDQDASRIHPGIEALICAELDGLGGGYSAVLDARGQTGAHSGEWVRILLSRLDSLHFSIETLRALLTTYAISCKVERPTVARWLGLPVSDVDLYVTRWATAQIAGAIGSQCPSKDVDSQEAFRGAILISEQPDRYVNKAEQVMEHLALLYTSDWAADQCTWVSEKTRKAIKSGWYVQPKRAASPTKSPSRIPPSPSPDAGEEAEAA
ncbi:hypothetical protein [Streptomyces sp. GbtcB7]|uniref:hypothetical protein n=1 Tax=Streptomyces sp. GbtcB7 TaxID=2824752 RepID=UPI001C300DF1|nr:hypothetical protein [Streptomyces sp. GbtcB7]